MNQMHAIFTTAAMMGSVLHVASLAKMPPEFQPE
jgi:hypothetical protein